MRFRSAGRLHPDLVGRRVTVRLRDDDGRARDILGVLTDLGDTTATVAREDGTAEGFALARVIAAREIRPPGTPRPAPGAAP